MIGVFFLLLPFAPAECLPVAGDSVTAADLAPALPAFAGLESGTVLLPSPVPGGRRILTPVDLRRLMARHGVEPDASTGLASVCLLRDVRMLTEGEILEALKRALPVEAEIELVEFSRYGVPRGSVVFDKRGMSAAPAASVHQPVLWRGAVKSESGRTTPIWARVRLFADAEVLVAKRDLAPGTVIQADDLARERRRMPGLASAPVTSAELEHRTPRRLIRAGERITAALTLAAPEVRAGQQVNVEVREGAVRLALPARAETSGRTGARIWLRAGENGKRFPARVTGPGQAEVETESLP